MRTGLRSGRAWADARNAQQPLVEPIPGPSWSSEDGSGRRRPTDQEQGDRRPVARRRRPHRSAQGHKARPTCRLGRPSGACRVRPQASVYQSARPVKLAESTWVSGPGLSRDWPYAAGNALAGGWLPWTWGGLGRLHTAIRTVRRPSPVTAGRSSGEWSTVGRPKTGRPAMLGVNRSGDEQKAPVGSRIKATSLAGDQASP